MSERYSLVFGGHIDYSDGDFGATGDIEDYFNTLLYSLARELYEELRLSELRIASQVGVVVDHSSRKASQHVALVFEVATLPRVDVLATEEFATALNQSVRWCDDIRELTDADALFDPWSRILIQRYLAPGNA